MIWAFLSFVPSQNPSNGHTHIVYKLKTPVCTSEHGSRKALDYLAKIQAGLVRETRADTGYTNFCITKNPMHEHWRTEVWTKAAELFSRIR
ncbi:replication initiation protein [Psychrobacter sp. AOP7-B1-24]|uniref:replication initiation protein n=1 Tax=Psychrobacter sp. AOP7-B1-24 TaxID=3457645 RepID=UPI00402B0D20